MTSKKEFRRNWARLIQKIYEVDPLLCPKCGGQMRIIAFIEEQAVIEKILKHLGLWLTANFLAGSGLRTKKSREVSPGFPKIGDKIPLARKTLARKNEIPESPPPRGNVREVHRRN